MNLRNLNIKAYYSKFGMDVFWNIASLAILAFGGIFINLIIIRWRGAEVLGVFNQVYAIYIFLSQIGVGGLQFSVLKHISYHTDDLKLCSDITASALILVTILTILMGVVCGFLAVPIGTLLKSPGVIIGLWMIIPGLLFFALNKVLINVLNGLSQMRAYAVFRSLRYIFIPLSIVVIILLKMPDPYIALSLTITEILLFFGLVIYINIRLFPLWGTSNRQAWFSEHISFGIRGALSGILIELNTRVDVLMLGYFSTDAVVGIYSFVSTLAEGFGQIPFAVRWNVDPILGKYFSEGTVEKISDLAKKIRRLFYPLMGVMGVAVILLYPVGYALLVKDSSLVISWITFSIIMIGVIINSGYRPFTGILLQGGRPGAYTLFYVGLVLNDALLNLFFIPYYGIYGAAGVTALTYVLEAVVLVIMARKLFNVRL